MIVGEGGVKIIALAIDALVHGPQEGFFGPRPNTGVGVRCDVRRVDRPERRCQIETARERLAAKAGVADGTIAYADERLPRFHQFGGENGALGRLDGRDLWVAAGPAKGRYGERGNNDHDRREDSGGAHNVTPACSSLMSRRRQALRPRRIGSPAQLLGEAETDVVGGQSPILSEAEPGQLAPLAMESAAAHNAPPAVAFEATDGRRLER